MVTKYTKALHIEQQKLNELVDEALENGIPLLETYDIIEQCKKFNEMMLECNDEE